MAVARPPTYRVRKPKAAPGPGGVVTAGTPASEAASRQSGRFMGPSSQLAQKIKQEQESGRAVGLPTANPFANPSAPATSTPGTPTPTVGAPAPAPSVAPPETLQGLDLRTGAGQGYGTTMADIDRRLLQAALDYGGVENVQQAGLSGDKDTLYNVPVTANAPNSRVAGIARTLTDATRSTSEDLNNRGSYFSGSHLEQQGRLDDQAGRDRQQALTDYQRAVADLMTQLAEARNARDEANRQAALADIAGAASTTPQASAGAPEQELPTGGGRPVSGGGRPAAAAAVPLTPVQAATQQAGQPMQGSSQLAQFIAQLQAKKKR